MLSFSPLLLVTYLGGLAALSASTDLQFCPASEEAIARQVLHFEDLSSISFSEFLKTLDEYKMSFEKRHLRKANLRNCDGPLNLSASKAYMVFAGFDGSENFTRNYLVVFNEDGLLTHVEARHSYPPPSH